MSNRAPVLVLMLAASLVAPAQASAQAPGHPFGLGLHFGDPTGFGMKYWLDGDNAVQGVLGWHAVGARGLAITADWSRRLARIQPRTPNVRFGFELGVGGGFGWVDSGCYDYLGRRYCYDEEPALLFRVPLTFAAYFPKVQLEAYAELTPGILLLPEPGPLLMGGFGGRFYF